MQQPLRARSIYTCRSQVVPPIPIIRMMLSPQAL